MLEEALQMARCETALVLANSPSKFINQALHLYFPDCTVEAIEGYRSSGAYRDAVRLAMTELIESLSTSSSSASYSSDSDLEASFVPPNSPSPTDIPVERCSHHVFNSPYCARGS